MHTYFNKINHNEEKREEWGCRVREYELIIEIDGYEPISEIPRTLELASSNADMSVSENDIETAVLDYFAYAEEIKEKFVALGGVTYMRNATSSRWGTIILPYELKSNELVTYYELS